MDRGRSVEPRNPVDEGQVEQDAREASRSRHGGAVDEATQAIFRDKLSLRAEDARSLWGWSMPVQIGSMDKVIYLVDSDSPLLARESDGLLVPKVRFSNLFLPTLTPRHAADPKIRKLLMEEQKKRQSILYAHSSFPTSASDAVFFGPDTYRFLSFLFSALADLPAPDASGQWKLGVDVGTGAGAGALAIAGLKKAEGPAELDAQPAKATKDEEPLVARVLGMDINPKALAFAEVNGSLYHRHSSLCSSYSLSPSGAEEEATWGDRLKFRESDLLQALTDQEKGEVDLIISNPPYIAFGSEDAIPEEDEDEEGGEGSRGRTRTPPSRAGKKGASYGEYTPRPARIALHLPESSADQIISSHSLPAASSADGGSSRGLSLPLAILHESLRLLPPGGLCLLYTGVPVSLTGHNPLREACEEYNTRAEQGGAEAPLVSQAGDMSLNSVGKTEGGRKAGSSGAGVKARLEYWTTIDADVFGDELADPTGPYGGGSGVGRIEVVGVGMRKL